MGKVFSFIGATIGGYAGWALGATIGTASAFIVSMVGTGIGIYYGRRIARNYRASCSTGSSTDHRRLRLVAEDLTCDSADDRTRRYLLRVVAGVAVANLVDLR